MLFVREDDVRLLLRAEAGAPIEDLLIPNAAYNEGNGPDTVLPSLSRIMPIDRARHRFLLLLSTQLYEGFGDLLYVVNGKPAAALLLLDSRNIDLVIKQRRNGIVSAAGNWSWAGHATKLELGKDVRVADAACHPLLARMIDGGQLQAVSTVSGTKGQEDSVALTFEFRQKPALTRCRAASRVAP